MKHFDIAQWTDFARDLVNPADRAAMEKHLLSGCPQCQRTAALLNKVAAAARAEGQYRIPDYEVHCAKAVYLLQQPEKVQILSRVPCMLAYDSFREPLPAGMRTRQRISRQVLYQTGKYWLDMRLEHEKGSSRITLVGQIANQQAPNRFTADVPVILVSGKQVVAQAVSNQFGEFQLAYEPAKHLKLYVPVACKGKRVERFLDRLLAQK